MTKLSNILMTGAALFTFNQSAAAEEVTLRALDGSFAMVGDLVGFADGHYLLQSLFGEVSVKANLAECIGDACAQYAPVNSEFGIAGLEILTKMLVPSLLVEYGRSTDYQVAIGEGNGVGSMGITFHNSNDVLAATIAVTGNGTVGGYELLAEKAASIVLAGRPPNAEEIASIANSGQGDLGQSRNQEVIAMEALIFLVANQNPVRSLTSQQVNDIFVGKITNWAEVGGYDAPINVYRRRDGDAITNVIRNDIFVDHDMPFAETAIIIPDEESLSDVVAADPFGLGFSHFSEIADARALSIRGNCGLLSSPTTFNIKSEEYPFSHRLYAFVPDGELPHVAQGFMDYIVTTEAQAAVERAGFISGTIETATADDQGFRFANAILASQDEAGLRDLLSMTAELIDAERLSTTLRFETSSSRLDVRAETDIQRLVDLFSEKDFSAREILLVGYSDSVGSASNNVGLGRLRAEQVLDQIRAIAPPEVLAKLSFVTQGRGEVSPIACNDAQHGRFINRRVEIWIRSKI